MRLDFISKNKIIWAILLVALLFRLWGFDYGLPEVYKYDERSFVNPALNIVENADPNPHWFGHPGGFIIYMEVLLVVLITVGYYLLLMIEGEVSSWDQFLVVLRSNFDFNPGAYHYAGRLMIIVCALVTIYVVYKIGKDFFSKSTGLLAALCLALLPLHIKHSQIIRTDVATTMWIMLAIYFLLKFLDKPENARNLFIASVFGGFSVATKYTSGLILFPVLICAGWNDIQNNYSNRFFLDSLKIKSCFSISSLLFFAGFFIFSPFVILDAPHAIADILHETGAARPGIESDGIIANYLWYLKGVFFKEGNGIVIAILAMLGLILIIKKRNMRSVVFVLFPVLYFMIVGGARLRWQRWMIPLLPFEALFFGCAITFLRTRWQNKILLHKSVKYILPVLCIVAFLPMLAQNIKSGQWQSKTDTRTLARSWILDNIPTGSSIAYRIYGPHLQRRYSDKYDLTYLSWETYSEDIEYYQKLNIEYLITSGRTRKLAQKLPDRFTNEIRFYKQLEANSTLIKHYPARENPGPEIRIYRLNKTGDN